MIAAMNMALALAATQPAIEVDCVDPPNQAAMNRCAARAFDRADAELNRVWRDAIAAARAADREPHVQGDGRPGGEAVLRQAQRAWLTFRDAHCTHEGYEARGGSMEAMIYNGCRARLTRERVMQLTGAEER